MQEDKYYDWSARKPLCAADGCPYRDWSRAEGRYAFAVHEKGFLVFLSAGDIGESDEYAERDPYTVTEDFDSGFQRRRFACTNHLVELALRDRGERPRILDVGCGQGHITAGLLNNHPNAEVSGLDHSISAIRYAAEHIRGIEFIVADAYEAPYRPDYFDLVVCNNLWEHVPDPLRLLESIRRVTQPHGYLVVSTPSRYRISNVVRVLTGRPVNFVSKLHVTEYTVGQVSEQLRFGGYDLLQSYSRPARGDRRTLKQRLGHAILKPVIATLLRLVRSHHSLEDTVFYIARKRV